MLFLVKLEDWSRATPPDEPMHAFERAEATFMRALAVDGRADDASLARQDALAREALAQGIDATEKLTLWAGRIGMRLREHQLKSLPPGAARMRRPLVAIQAPSVAPDAHLCEAVRACADAVALPLAWSVVNRGEGVLDPPHAEAWAAWAVRDAKAPVIAGPIVDFRPGRARVDRGLAQRLRVPARDRLRAPPARLQPLRARVVSRWTPVTGLNLNDSFILTVEQMLDLLRLSIMAVRKFNPHAHPPRGRPALRRIRHAQPTSPSAAALRRDGRPAGPQVDALDLPCRWAIPPRGTATRHHATLRPHRPLRAPASLSRSRSARPAHSRPPRSSSPRHGARSWRGGWSPRHRRRARPDPDGGARKPCVIGARGSNSPTRPPAQRWSAAAS